MDYQSYLKTTGKYQEPVKEVEETLNKGIDWEQRRYEIARAALVGSLAAPIRPGVDPFVPADEHAKYAVQLADALIKELKK